MNAEKCEAVLRVNEKVSKFQRDTAGLPLKLRQCGFTRIHVAQLRRALAEMRKP